MLARRLVQFTPPTRGCTRSRVQRGTWGCCWGPARTTRPPWPCPPAPRKGSRRCGTTCCCCGARWRSSARSWCPDPGPGAGHTTGGGGKFGRNGVGWQGGGPPGRWLAVDIFRRGARRPRSQPGAPAGWRPTTAVFSSDGCAADELVWGWPPCPSGWSSRAGILFAQGPPVSLRAGH